MTTTSTTGYVNVETPSVSGTQAPSAPPFRSDGTPSEAWSSGIEGPLPNTKRNRKLRKLRPLTQVTLPADPAEVLARTQYNHTVSRSDASSPHSESPSSYAAEHAAPAAKNLKRQKSMVKVVKDTVDRLTRCRRGSESSDDMWVCVNVAHKVTQYVCALDLEP